MRTTTSAGLWGLEQALQEKHERQWDRIKLLVRLVVDGEATRAQCTRLHQLLRWASLGVPAGFHGGDELWSLRCRNRKKHDEQRRRERWAEPDVNEPFTIW